ncbi:MAG: SDR family NAD(P)-dependent oxidoreductase [Candidatus Binatia bacterium]
MNRLAGKSAIVTGAAGGIGLATAKRFAAEGAKVLMVDLDADRLRREAEAIAHPALSWFAADVAREHDTAAYVQAAMERNGAIDVLVANAGILGPIAPLTELSVEAFDAVLAVNVRGVWLAMKHAIPHMRARGRGGSVVLISSIAGLKGYAGIAPYTASKHAVKGLMRSAAIECGPFGIRVNSVHPGSTQTRMIDALAEGISPGAPERGRAALEGSTLLGRYATPEEMAEVILFLASDESSFCTGGVFPVDGGQSTK